MSTPDIIDLPDCITIDELQSHIAVEDALRRRIPIAFGTRITQEDADRIMNAYQHLRKLKDQDRHD